MSELNILYSTNDNYAVHAAASIYSLLENNKESKKINLLIIDDDISPDSRKKLEDIVSKFSNAQISFYPFGELRKKLVINDKSGFAQAGYARLMISNIVEFDKILYIDCDTIVNNSLRGLWETDISDYYIAGVQDNPAMYCSKVIGMKASDKYINSGVMLINLKKWRKDGIEQKILDMIKEYNGFVWHHDQGIVNGVCKDKILILHPKYNTMSQFYQFNAQQIKKLFDIQNYYTQNELDEAVKAPVIIHYLSKFFYRPWFSNCSHPLKRLYINFVEKSGFDLEPIKYKPTKSLKIRMFFFRHTPFLVYAFVEKLLDKKRLKFLKKHYSDMELNI